MKGVGGSGDMEKGRQVCGGEVVNSFKCYEKDLEVDAMFNGEPVKLLKDGVMW